MARTRVSTIVRIASISTSGRFGEESIEFELLTRWNNSLRCEMKIVVEGSDEMMLCSCSRIYFVGIYIISIGLIYCSPPHNVPPCHPGMFRYFGWCEQSDCEDQCTCLSSKSVCKQICSHDKCNLLNCSTEFNCFQRVLLSDYTSTPRVNKMISSSPIIQQDCSHGNCELMKAMRYRNRFTRTFQSCSGGHCRNVQSKADHTKQFCGNCDSMTCDGEHASNCTQLCIIGKCKNVYCNAKHCKQLCSHDSTCNLTCGENTEVCVQTCSHGSTCMMNCSAKVCKQTCNEHKSCVKNQLRTTTVATTTTVPSTSIENTTILKTTSTIKLATTSTSATTSSSATPSVLSTNSKIMNNTYIPSSIKTFVKRRTPITITVQYPSSSALLSFSYISVILPFILVMLPCQLLT